MARWLITTPNRNYSGVTAGVPFVNGQAEVTDETTRNVLVNNYGYTAEEVAGVVVDATPPAKKAKK